MRDSEQLLHALSRRGGAAQSHGCNNEFFWFFFCETTWVRGNFHCLREGDCLGLHQELCSLICPLPMQRGRLSVTSLRTYVLHCLRLRRRAQIERGNFHCSCTDETVWDFAKNLCSLFFPVPTQRGRLSGMSPAEHCTSCRGFSYITICKGSVSTRLTDGVGSVYNEINIATQCSDQRGNRQGRRPTFAQPITSTLLRRKVRFAEMLLQPKPTGKGASGILSFSMRRKHLQGFIHQCVPPGGTACSTGLVNA